MWVKLTMVSDGDVDDVIYVNLDRFDTIYKAYDKDGHQVTRIRSCISDDEADFTTIDVLEPPEKFMDPPKMKVPDDEQ